MSQNTNAMPNQAPKDGNKQPEIITTTPPGQPANAPAEKTAQPERKV